jgi:hypothetical protein
MPTDFYQDPKIMQSEKARVSSNGVGTSGYPQAKTPQPVLHFMQNLTQNEPEKKQKNFQNWVLLSSSVLKVCTRSWVPSFSLALQK